MSSVSPPRRHQTTGAVIARCGQPEVSWWGWRNADDEHLVQSIAKACAVDSSSCKHLSNGNYTNGSDLPDTDFGESSHSALLRSLADILYSPTNKDTHPAAHTDRYFQAEVFAFCVRQMRSTVRPVGACLTQHVHTITLR